MNPKKILVSLIALFAVMTVMTFVAATHSSIDVTIRGLEVDSGDRIVASSGEVLPIRVDFEADGNFKEALVEAWISGHRSKTSVSTDRFEIIGDSNKSNIYSKLLSLKVPSNLDETDEDFLLIVRVESNNDFFDTEVQLNLQRKSFELDMLSVNTATNTVSAGESLPLYVVLKNRGFNELEDVFVVARITKLGVERTVFFGDLAEEDKGGDEADKEDSLERVVSLRIPSEAEEGIYTVEIEAFNEDVLTRATKTISVLGDKAGDVLAVTPSRTIGSGENTFFELVLLNPGNRLKTYTLIPEQVEGLTITASEAIVSVAADSSRTVKINVAADDNAEEGRYNFSVNVMENGKLVKKVDLLTVISGEAPANQLTVLIVILAIIFVVLLVVLIVLLTRKPNQTEESGESYY